MLKIFFWILLLGNGALFAYHQGYLAAWFAASHEPARMARQLNVEQIRLVPANQAGNPASKEKAGVNGAGPASPAVPDPAPAVAEKAAVAAIPAAVAIPAVAETAPQVIACTEVGNFTESDATRFETQLASLTLGTRLSRRVAKENGSYMVYMPPQGDKENADKKVGQLRNLGVTDFYVIQDNSDFRWGISLGIFRTEEAAKARLAQISQQGVRTARVGPRNVTSKVVFQLRDLAPAAKGSLDKIKADYPQQQLRNCS